MWAGFVWGEKVRGEAGRLERFKWRMIVIWLSPVKKSSGGKRLAGRSLVSRRTLHRCLFCPVPCYSRGTRPLSALQSGTESRILIFCQWLNEQGKANHLSPFLTPPLINVHWTCGTFKTHYLVRVGEIYEWLEIKGTDYMRNTSIEIAVLSMNTRVGVCCVH